MWEIKKYNHIYFYLDEGVQIYTSRFKIVLIIGRMGLYGHIIKFRIFLMRWMIGDRN